MSSPGTSIFQSYGKAVLDTDDTDTARSKIEAEIRRLPTATWQWENQSSENPLGDLRVFQKLPAIRLHEQTGKKAFFNNIISRYLNAKNNQTLDPPYLNKEGAYQPPALVGMVPRFCRMLLKICYSMQTDPLFLTSIWKRPFKLWSMSILRIATTPNTDMDRETRSLVSWTAGDVLLLDVCSNHPSHSLSNDSN